MVNRKPKGIIYETIPKTVFPCLVTPLRHSGESRNPEDTFP